MHAVLGGLLPANRSLAFYPSAHYEFRNEWEISRRLRRSSFPVADSTAAKEWAVTLANQSNATARPCDPAAGNYAGPVADRKAESKAAGLDRAASAAAPGTIAIIHGGFVESFADRLHDGAFDLVVTCFFLDTADDLLRYVAVIAHVLAPGGLWVNAGPLHHHSTRSVPYTHAEVLGLADAGGLDLLEQRELTTSYAGEHDVRMNPESFTIPLTVWRLGRPDRRFSLGALL